MFAPMTVHWSVGISSTRRRLPVITSSPTRRRWKAEVTGAGNVPVRGKHAEHAPRDLY
jgi:hypothetical protein